jgi:hypothetical protein
VYDYLLGGTDNYAIDRAAADHANTRGNFGRIRSREEVRAFFGGLEPVEPGLVDIRDWRPDDRGEEQADRWFVFGGVARRSPATARATASSSA